MGYKKIIPKHPGANSSNMTMVGIGVDDPTTNLDVLGDVRIRDSQGLFFKRHGDDYAWRMRNESSADGTTNGFNTSNDLVFAVVTNSGVITGSGSPPPSATSHTVYGNSANTLVLKESGNVGIGTSSPTSKLFVADPGTTLPTGITSGTGFSVGRADGLIGLSIGYLASNQSSYLQAKNFTNTNMLPLSLNPLGGNVGIGTSTPATPLDVTVAGGGNYIATFQNTTSATPYGVFIKDAASGAAGYPLLAVTDSAGTTSHLRVDSSTGNVGIGTSSPFTKLHVNGNILSAQVFVGGGRSDGTSATRVIGWYQGGSGDSSYTYRHLRTSLWGGGAALGNSQYIMGGFHIQSYRYYQGGGNSDAWITFHNWGGSAQNGYNYTYVGNWNADSYVYVDSTGYITLRLSNDIYQGHHVDLHQFPIYPARDIRITGIINSSSGTL